VKKTPKAPRRQAKPEAKKPEPPAVPSELVKLADFINPRVLDAAQMVMVVAAALEPKPGAVPTALGDEARTGLVRILQEITEIIMSIKSEVAAAVHGPPAPAS
jgi:hypothetical protein